MDYFGLAKDGTTFQISPTNVVLDVTKVYLIEIEVSDKYVNKKVTLQVDAGQPIFFIDAENSLGFNDFPIYRMSSV